MRINRPFSHHYIYVFLWSLFCSAPLASANTIVLTMDDLPTQVLDGLVHPSGVTFGYSVGGNPSIDAIYRSPTGPGTTTYVSDPSIEANSDGMITLSFANPTPILEFGIVFDTNSSINDAAVVELFDAMNVLITTLGIDISDLGFGFSENQAIYSGTPLSSAKISFPNVPADTALVIDNLKFEATPEPSTLVLGLLGIGLCQYRRRRSRAHQTTAT